MPNKSHFLAFNLLNVAVYRHSLYPRFSLISSLPIRLIRTFTSNVFRATFKLFTCTLPQLRINALDGSVRERRICTVNSTIIRTAVSPATFLLPAYSLRVVTCSNSVRAPVRLSIDVTTDRGRVLVADADVTNFHESATLLGRATRDTGVPPERRTRFDPS